MSVFVRRHGVTIGLAILVIGLGVALLVDRGRPADDEREPRGVKLVDAWRREDVSALEIEIGGRTMKVERRVDPRAGRDWRMILPDEGPCDASVVDRTLTALELARPVRKVTPGSPAGLDRPRARGVVSMGKSSFRFAVGGPATTPEGASYFQIEGHDAVVISRDLTTELTKAPDAYRDHNLAPYRPQEITAVEITGALGRLSLVRRGLGWGTAEGRVRAPRDAVDRMWHGYADLRAESFLDAPPREETSRVEMTSDHGEVVRYRIGGACADAAETAVERIIGTRSVSACVPRGAVTAFTMTPEERVDRRLFHARPDELVELVIEAGGEKLELARKESGFRLRAPVARDLEPIEADHVTQELARLFAEEARAVSDKPSAGPPVGKIVLDAQGGEEVILVFADHRLLRKDDGAWLEPTDALVTRLARPSAMATPPPPPASGDR